MPPPTTASEFLELVRKGDVADAAALSARLAEAGPEANASAAAAAGFLVAQGLLTRFQAGILLQGRCRNLVLCSKYVVLEPVGAGGMGTVYLCSHRVMRRPVAVKVLPAKLAERPEAVERFLREARAVARLRHPNIVIAHDVDRAGPLHFLVMEFVDGVSLQALVTRSGPLDVTRAVNYTLQAALGLQHAHEAGLVHRDIKPSNLLVDRSGVVKILDLGLARFFVNDADPVTRKYDGNAVLGTLEYLAPEQATDGLNVDHRCDIYSLGLTLYCLLTGRTPFAGGTAAQKLLRHQMGQLTPVRELRPEVPEGLAAVLARMTAREPEARFQSAGELVSALAPWCQAPVLPPTEQEIPPPGHAARLAGVSGTVSTVTQMTPSGLSAAVRPVTPPPAARRPVLPFAWMVAGAVLLVLAAGGLAVGLGLALSRPTPVAVVPTAPERPPTVPDEGSAPPAKPAVPGVAVEKEGDGLRVKTARYDAFIDGDGCLNGLRVGGVEFLRSGDPLEGGKSVTHGAYFFSTRDGHQGAVRLPDVRRPEPNVVTARGNKFDVRYEFTPEAVTVTARNATDFALPFFMIVDALPVTAVVDSRGTRSPVPLSRHPNEPAGPEWETTTWVAGRSRLTISGANKVWGPFGQGQVLEASLKDYETRTIRFEPEVADHDEAESIPPGGVLVTRQLTTRRATSDLYEAVVESDGCLTSLRVDGVEFLRPGVSISRGLYFHQGLTQRLPEVAQSGATAISARGDSAAVLYEFGPDKVSFQLENRTDQTMAYYAVFDPGVTAVRDGNDSWQRTPVGDQSTPPGPAGGTTTWFAGRARVTLRGGSRIWGPWERQYQVWEATLAPREKRIVTAEIGLTSATEARKAAEVAGTKEVAASDLAVYTPADYQVFQRQSRTRGTVALRGRVRVPFERLEYRLIGTPLEGALPDGWQPIATPAGAGAFEGRVPTPAGGWYRLELRALREGKEVARSEVGHVGVGEVFVGAGQSNATNCGQERTRQTSGMVAALGGTGWRLAEDPLPGTHDEGLPGCQGGSPWLAFGDAMYEKYHVPIGFASTGHSGTSVTEWRPGGELFGWTTGRMNQLGRNGFRSVLWHQGESDTGMESGEYERRLTAVIRESGRTAGWEVPWFVARVSYHNPRDVASPSTRDAQKRLWDAGIALEGPDTDKLTGDNRDNDGQGIHFSPKGLTAHGRMWAEKVAVWLDKALTD